MLTANDGMNEVRIGCSTNGRVVTLLSSIITGEAGEEATVDVDGETSEDIQPEGNVVGHSGQ